MENIEIKLTESQKQVVKQHNDIVKSLQDQFKSENDTFRAFVIGITSTKEIEGNYNYEVKEDKIIIKFKEAEAIPEE